MNLLARLVLALILLLVLDVRTCTAENSEDQIKTAFVLNFVKFTEWPVEFQANDKLTLCVVGSNALGGALASLEGRKVENHELHVVQLSSEELQLTPPKTNSVSSSCRAVFIGQSERNRFLPIIQSLGYSPVLTISDIDDFAEKGGCIGLRFRENKIIFETNLASVQRSKLHLPGQLLNLSSHVFGR